MAMRTIIIYPRTPTLNGLHTTTSRVLRADRRGGNAGPVWTARRLRAWEWSADLSPKHIYWRTSVTFPWPVSRLRTVVGSPLVIWLADWPATSRPDHSVTEEETFLYFLTRQLYFLAVQQELHSHHSLSGHSLYVIVVHLCVRSHTGALRHTLATFLKRGRPCLQHKLSRSNFLIQYIFKT